MKKFLLLFLIIGVKSYSQCWNKILLGGEQSFASKTDNTFLVWGRNDFGELGIGVTGLLNSPTQQPININWQQYSIGFSYGLGLKSDGTIWSWGNNQTGQLGLGLGPTSNMLNPTQIGTQSNWVWVSAKSYSSFAIKTDGTLWAWGQNSNRQLGGSNLDQVYAPIQIGTANNWQKIYAGYGHTMAIRTDGSLWGWGAMNGNYGQVGTGTSVATITPTQIGNDTNWTDVSLGMYFTLALKSDGTLWSWGKNDYGQLGDGTTLNKSIPTQVGSDSDWESISADTSFSIALKTNGTLWAWGQNTHGQLGNGTSTMFQGIVPNPVVTQIGTDEDWTAVSAGQLHVGAIKENGSLWMWGYNESACLGLGFTPTTIQASQNPNPTELSCPQLSINSSEISQFTIYPNPTENTLYIQNSTNLEIDKILITTVLGNSIFQTNSSTQPIDVSKFAAGVYFIHFYLKDRMFSKKFIVN